VPVLVSFPPLGKVKNASGSIARTAGTRDIRIRDQIPVLFCIDRPASAPI
jgi:hypothetical protein